MNQSERSKCPLCGEPRPEEFYADKTREYLRCCVCQLIFVPAAWHLAPAEEKAIYDHHQNSPDDLRYRAFLSRLADPVLQQLQPGSCGLDFGSGPGPTLSVMFEEHGHQMSIFDPFYSPSRDPLRRQYDFVTATEVLEHLSHPAQDLNRMWNCVKPGGLLAVMTQPAPSLADFETWHYKNDPTHVSFFCEATFAWLAKQKNAELITCSREVTILRCCSVVR